MTQAQNNALNNELLLLKMFNNRDADSFGKVYLHFYDELHYFANKIFHDINIVSEDVIQDIFMSIWENNNKKFDSIDGIKSYLYISIKNRFLKQIRHTKCINEHQKYCKKFEDDFIMLVAENEIITQLHCCIELIPKECAKVFELCLEGWEVKEIAAKLNKSESTIYKQRNEAIRVLRKKISYDKLFIIISLLN